LENHEDKDFNQVEIHNEQDIFNNFHRGEELRKLEEKVKLERQFQTGYGWFYWIAGLSLINTLVYMFGLDWSFIIGLGITQILDSIAYEVQGVSRAIFLFINLIITGIFIVLALLSKRGYSWAFVVGMILYVLDGIIFILFQDWAGTAFHLLALYGIYMGLRANIRMKRLRWEGYLE
jgi:hypothetical protein